MNGPIELSFVAKLEEKFSQQTVREDDQQAAREDEEFDLFAEESEEDRIRREQSNEARRQQVAREAQEKQEAYERRRDAYDRGEIEPVEVDAAPLKRAVAIAVNAPDTPLVALADALGLVLMGGNRESLENEELGDSTWLGAIETGYNISQRHYADGGNKRFGTATALLCLAYGGTYPSNQEITKLANLLNDVLDDDLTAEDAAAAMME